MIAIFSLLAVFSISLGASAESMGIVDNKVVKLVGKPEEPARENFVVGEVEASDGEAYVDGRRAVKGTKVYLNSRLEVRGPSGFLRTKFNTGMQLQVGPNSSLFAEPAFIKERQTNSLSTVFRVLRGSASIIGGTPVRAPGEIIYANIIGIRG